MKNLTMLFILFAIIGFNSCNQSGDWTQKITNADDLIAQFSQVKNATVTEFISDSNILINPYDIFWMKDLLIITDEGNKLLTIYNNQSKNFLGKMISHGRGPFEFLSVSVHPYCADTLMVSSILGERKSIYLYSYNSVKKCLTHPDRVITLNYQQPADKVSTCIVFCNKIISSGQFGQGVFHEFDLEGKFIKAFDNYPIIKNTMDFNNYHLGHVFGYNTSFAINKSQSKFASTDRNSLTIHNYDTIKDEYIKSFFVQWHVPVVPKTTIDEKGNNVTIRSASGCIIGSGQLVSMGDLLYTAFSTSTIFDAMQSPNPNYYDMLLCFDWNGSPVSIVKLDKKICKDLITNDNKTKLYSMRVDEITGFKKIVEINIY